MTEPTGPPLRPAPAPTTWADRIGPRIDARPEPRVAVTLAAAGCALAVLGVLVIAGDLLVPDSADAFGAGEPNRVPGILLSLLVLGLGELLLVRFANGPLATAGVVASGLAVPPLLFFVTLDPDGFPPFSADTIFGLSAIAWLVAYVAGPGRGHSFYLGAGLLSLWLFVLEITEGIISFPFALLGSFQVGVEPGFDDGFGADPFSGQPVTPNPEVLGILSLLFAVGCAFAARRADEHGNEGLATPFALTALITAPVGLLFLSDLLGELLTGLAFVALGVVFATLGARSQRRFTTWVGGAFVVQGLVVVVAEVTGDEPSATLVGLLFIVLGVGVVAAGFAVSSELGEPLETEPGPSTFRRPAPRPPSPPTQPEPDLSRLPPPPSQPPSAPPPPSPPLG